MPSLNCKHCDGVLNPEDQHCPHCGIPLAPNHANEKQRRFTLWFIALVIFCLLMMLWLPPDWTHFIEK
ncbi:MAG: hypothetical protein KAG28_10540 [Cocleimonas sp.]|nr:hypothetical protein [Cocleimonas sp.]